MRPAGNALPLSETQLGDHLCLIYNSVQEQFAAIIPFLKQGFGHNEQCIYILDESSAETIVDELRNVGIEAEREITRGALHVLSRGAYLHEGRFDPDWMIYFLERSVAAAKQEGFRGLRVTGEMTWALGGQPGTERLLEFEAKLNETVFSKCDVAGLCQYHRTQFDAAIVRNVIHTHPLVIHEDAVCYNRHFIPAAEFLSGDAGRGVIEVDRMLDQLSALNRLEEQRIRAQSKAEEMAELSRRVLESSHDCIQILDPDGKLLYINEGGQRLLELEDVQEYLNTSWIDCWVSSDRDLAVKAIQKAREGSPGHFEGSCTTAKGNSKRWDVVVTPIHSPAGVVERLLAVSRDITERKLADEVLRRAEKFAVAGRLAATVSHEINNPLAAAIDLVFLIKSDASLSSKTREHVSLLDEQLSRVATISKMILNFYKEPPTPTRVAMAEIVDEVRAMYSLAASQRGTSVVNRVPADLEAIANAGELRQVLANLVGNAVDACANGTIEVTGDRDPEGVSLTVKDDGVGIAPENLKRLFDPFFTTKGQAGTGLGLWIAKEIVQKYGGSLSVESNINGATGTKFTLRFPAALSLQAA